MYPQELAFWPMLAAAAVLFWVLPRRLRYGFLGLASAIWLATRGEAAQRGVLALGVLFVLFWAATPLVRPGKTGRTSVLWGLILVVAGFLGLFKYLPGLARDLFGDENALLLPLGISYFSFKLIHYVVEVALGNVRERSLPQFLCWLFLFPTFTVGPIQRYDLFLADQEERWSFDSLCYGLTRLVHGLIKKFVIAKVLSDRLNEGRTTPETMQAVLGELSPLTVWGYAAAMYAWIYFDFSGYTDMAIGASRLFGIRIQENFHFPWVANNIREYWRRWHMSLSGWCQSYVYMPVLGLYRNPLLSLYATFFVMGMWHTGTWTRLFWGLYHATGVAVYTWWNQTRRRRKWRRLPPRWELAIGIATTQLFVAGSMAFLINEGDTWGSLRIAAKLCFIDLPARTVEP